MTFGWYVKAIGPAALMGYFFGVAGIMGQQAAGLVPLAHQGTYRLGDFRSIKVLLLLVATASLLVTRALLRVARSYYQRCPCY